MNTNPEHYKLPSRIQLIEVDANHIGIVKKIKSRIISADARKILETVNSIIAVEPEVTVSLICHQNICSKSIKLLNENSVGVIYE